MDVIRLLTALESRYDIVIELDTLELTDIGSVESIADVVMARL
jgi:acyl carrier protein